jgi:hypothetical protein
MLLDALAQHLALRIAWLTRRLKELFPTTDSIIWLDEPLLPALNSPFCPITWDYGADLLELVFADASACHGIILNDFGARQRDHNLSSIWIPLLETSVDCILVDVYRYSSILLAAGEKLAEFLKRSGTVAWGLIPADEEMLTLETPATLTSRFEHMLDQLAEAGLSREQVVRSAFISTSGNLGLISVEAAEHALQLCSDVSAHLRATYGLTDTDQPGKRTPDKKPPIELSRVNRQEEL